MSGRNPSARTGLMSRTGSPDPTISYSSSTPLTLAIFMGPRLGVAPIGSVGMGTGRQGFDVGGVQRVARDAPVAGGDLFDDAPGDRARVLAFDLHHRVGEAANDLLFLVGGEDALDDLHIDQWHALNFLLVVGGMPASSARACGPPEMRKED